MPEVIITFRTPFTERKIEESLGPDVLGGPLDGNAGRFQLY
jgi:hypothetical protein